MGHQDLTSTSQSTRAPVAPPPLHPLPPKRTVYISPDNVEFPTTPPGTRAVVKVIVFNRDKQTHHVSTLCVQSVCLYYMYMCNNVPHVLYSQRCVQICFQHQSIACETLRCYTSIVHNTGCTVCSY